MRPILLALLCAAGCATLHAAPLTVLRQSYTYDLAADGSWTTEVDSARRIDEAAAVTAMGQAQVQYSESLQTLDILEAYTTTSAGMRIDVPADKIITQQLPASSGAPTFSDTKVRNVVFPQVELGATLTLRYRLKQLKPYLPGVFSVAALVNPFTDIKQASVTLRAPDNVKLYVSARDMQGGEVKSTVKGRREWQWTHGEAKAIVPEAGSLIAEMYSPYVLASTMATFPDLGTAYMLGAEKAAAVTPGVQKLADEITTGITDKRAQADALYRWVSTQIRYVAIFMGAGGYVPHLADEVIAARYGDCKDKSTLLMALLHAKGIRAMPVLIHAAPTYKLPDTAILAAFNHAINYLPDWDLFVDSTSGFAGFGVLASSLQNKEVLLGGDKTMRPAVRTTPAGSEKRDRTQQRIVATLAADGSVTGTMHIETLGSADPDLRGSLGALPEAIRPAIAKALLASTGQTGEATLKFSDARDLTLPFSADLTFNTSRHVNLPGPGAMSASLGLPLAQAFANSALQVDRKLDFPCPGGSGMEETLELTLPPQFTITTLPKGASIDSPYGRFTSSYEVKDSKLLMTRRLDVVSTRAVCTTADTAELRKFATAISQHLRSQLLYQ